MSTIRYFVFIFAILLPACSEKSNVEPDTDATPPNIVEDLAFQVSTDSSITLSWTAPGDDGTEGQAAQYEIRYSTDLLSEASWDSATIVDSPPVPQPAGELESFVVSGLVDGIWYLGLKTADEVPNWSELSNIVSPETIPPGGVTDLTHLVSTDNSITLSWTAPGDDGMEGQATQYEIRYSADLLSEASWDSAAVVGSPPVPQPAGEQESFVVSGLADGTWHLGLKAADEVPNWSVLSNVVSATLVDTIPPGRVTDLAAVFVTVSSVQLNWIAPGDDGGEGQASAYDLRYALFPITEESWDDALQVQDVAAPDPAGSRESLWVTDLRLATQYFFAIKAVDNASNWSELSNVAEGSTANLVRLTTSSGPYGGAMYPSWSPDGQTIAFNANWEHDTDQLYVMPASGGNPVRLTNRPQWEGAIAPRWSPDGTRLAFISMREDYPHTLRELSIMDAVPGAEPVLLASHGRQRIMGHAWSPDGSQIAYAVEVSQDPRVGEMYIISSSGGQPQLLLRGDWRYWALAWSPFGNQIAFTSNQHGNDDIWAVPASGGDPYRLTDDPAWDNRPDWSPDGTRIAFGSGRAGNGDGDIWLISLNERKPIRLTNDPRDESAPSWSPDGSRLAFTSWDNHVGDIWVLEW